MLNKLSQNLNFLMLKAHLSSNRLAKDTGVPSTTIKRIRNNTNANPTLISLLPLAHFFGISLSQLIGDTNLSNTQEKSILSNQKMLWTSVPIISWEQVLHRQKVNLMEVTYTLTDKKVSKKSYALMVKENNWKKLVHGTLLIIDPQLTPEENDYLVIYDKTQKFTTLKQLIFNNALPYIQSIETENQITELTNNHTILGIVVEYKKELRPIVCINH